MRHGSGAGGALQTWAALLKAGVGEPPFHVAFTISTILLLSSSVSAICLFKLATYARWCLPQWYSIVFCSIGGLKQQRMAIGV